MVTVRAGRGTHRKDEQKLRRLLYKLLHCQRRRASRLRNQLAKLADAINPAPQVFATIAGESDSLKAGPEAFTEAIVDLDRFLIGG